MTVLLRLLLPSAVGSACLLAATTFSSCYSQQPTACALAATLTAAIYGAYIRNPWIKCERTHTRGAIYLQPRRLLQRQVTHACGVHALEPLPPPAPSIRRRYAPFSMGMIERRTQRGSDTIGGHPPRPDGFIVLRRGLEVLPPTWRTLARWSGRQRRQPAP